MRIEFCSFELDRCTKVNMAERADENQSVQKLVSRSGFVPGLHSTGTNREEKKIL